MGLMTTRDGGMATVGVSMATFIDGHVGAGEHV
jgi:hypothetical protein